MVTENTHVSRPEPKIVQSPVKQGRSQNLKQVPQTFMEVFNLGDVRLASQLMMSYRKINITKEKIVNYRVPIVITDVKLASYSKKGLEFCFSFLSEEHLQFQFLLFFSICVSRCHSKIFELI